MYGLSLKYYFALLCVISICLCNNKYTLSNVKYSDSSRKNEIIADLTFSSENFDPSQYSCSQLRNPNNIKLISDLSLSLSLEYDDIVHVKITDKNKQRWEPKDIVSLNYKSNLRNFKGNKTFDNFGFTLYNDSFGFELYDPNSKEVYYTFSNETFLYSDTLLIFESFLTSNDIYGFGERSHEFKLGDGVYTIWPNDTGGIKYDHQKGGKNGYGHQPIGLHKTKLDDKFLGFVFINTNNQDVVIKTINENKVSLKHLTIGGVIDYYIIIGTTPDNVIKRIHFLLGAPALPPYWSLGWHHSRYGYKNELQFETVYANYKKHKVPIDTMWVDIDTLDNFKIFTLNKEKFETLPNFVNNTLHKEHTHFIPIVDLGISYEDNNFFVQLGKKLSTFIKSNYTKDILISKVWPGRTIFPDFYNPNTSLLWHYALSQYEDIVHFDGIWLDMNEPANLETTKCIGEVTDTCDPKDNFYYYDTLPYLPGYYEGEHTDMAASSINENAILYGEDELMTAAYNTKPMISYIESKVTYDYLYLSNKRPFILTRANNIGIGKYAFHWLGDNNANFNSLKYGISTIFTFNIFGIPMTGDDICGFFDDTTDELCARWHNVGAFYPFTRNHNFEGAVSNEPWDVGEKSLNAAKKAVSLRYSILRYIYSEMFMISINEKGSFFKPVLFEYPNDKDSYSNIDNRIMVGSSFILFPVLSSSTISIVVDFPNDNWNTFPEGKTYLSKGEKNKNVSLSGDFDSIHLFLRGGAIIPYQDTSAYVQNTYELRQLPTQIIINPDAEGKASGVIFFDNDDRDTIKKKRYFRADLSYSNGELSIAWNKNRMKHTQYEYKDNIISQIVILRYSSASNLKSTANVYINEEKKEVTMKIDKDNDKAIIDISKIGEVPIGAISKVIFY